MSEIRATTISNAAGTGPITMTGQSAAKAWSQFNAVGTATVIQSFNQSSLTDHDVGIYSVNFTSSLVANYCVNYSIFASYTDAASILVGYSGGGAAGLSSSGTGLKSQNTSGTRGDNTQNHVCVQGDLA